MLILYRWVLALVVLDPPFHESNMGFNSQWRHHLVANMALFTCKVWDYVLCPLYLLNNWYTHTQLFLCMYIYCVCVYVDDAVIHKLIIIVKKAILIPKELVGIDSRSWNLLVLEYNTFCGVNKVMFFFEVLIFIGRRICALLCLFNFLFLLWEFILIL